MNNSIMSLVFFVVALVIAILVGNYFISSLFGMPVSEAPAMLKVVVHGISLGIVFYAGAKFFSSR